jgi:hypothetical protein
MLNHFLQILKNIIIANGIYDLLCALSILGGVPLLSNLHISMIKEKDKGKGNNKERFLAYWIFTYGVLRLSNDRILISISYMLEAIFFSNEYLHNDLEENTGVFVIFFSLFLSILAFFYYP